MTVSVLIPTLDEELAALVRGETDACLVCGGPAVLEPGGAVACETCGLRLTTPAPPAGRVALA